MNEESGMLKQFGPEQWNGLPIDGDQQIKVASTGLGFCDRKTAESFASPELLHWLSRMETNPDCVYVHKVAMGCSDKYGPNRWGDGFRADVLDRDCPTFEQYAKAYRNHKSKSDDPFFGRPKIARFRKPMGVVELVTEYYGNDKVASANGGLVADKELEELAKHGSIAVSMGSKVPGDRCVACGNWAPKRAMYCEAKSRGGTCELFGCKRGMLKIAADGRQQYVDNPTNLFYDISYVGRGADPIAHGLVLPLGKLASAGSLDDYLKVAEYFPSNLIDVELRLTENARKMLKLAQVFADLEAKYASYSPDADVDLGMVYGVDYSDHVRAIHSNVSKVSKIAVRELARADICPDFESFASAAGYSAGKIASMKPIVADMYTQLSRQRAITSVVNSADFSEIYLPNLVTSKTACIHDGCTQASVLARSLSGNAEGAQLTTVPRLQASQTIPDIVAKYAAFKLAWAVHNPKIDPWRMNVLVKRELVTLANEPTK